VYELIFPYFPYSIKGFIVLKRRDFTIALGGAIGMSTLASLKKLSDALPENGMKMPVLFVGHGSPMNAIEDNEFSRKWREVALQIPQPVAVLCISAHWLTRGSYLTAAAEMKTIHDFGGFPRELFEVQYPAPGFPALAEETSKLVESTNVGLDHDWGFDHGSWSVVKNMYPEANIPMIQLSIDYYKPGQYHYELAKYLYALRKKGVLILGSGNMVHNLRMISIPPGSDPALGFNVDYGFDWALEMNDIFKNHIADKNHKPLWDYNRLHKDAHLAVPTPDHYWPLLYTLGVQDEKDEVSFFNDKAIAGSLTMTSVLMR
jgi:4,5-DOPA dioxygenase extradiol